MNGLEALNIYLIRRDLSWIWEQHNPILQKDEPALETDTRKLRIGDGVSNFMDLPYYEPIYEELDE